ncbi:MAG: hypothetical protein AAFZ92_03980 [Pseudomonadota bacterium]
MAKDHLGLYLKRYAEPETAAISQALGTTLSGSRHYQHCVVIPAYNESADFFDHIHQSALGKQSLLVIVIVNQPVADHNSEFNKRLWHTLSQRGHAAPIGEHHYLLSFDHKAVQLLVCDYFSENRRLGDKQGVGLARKLGCDIACGLRHQGLIKSPWLHTSDADTQLPDDYFSDLPDPGHYSALTYPYRHIGVNRTITEATLRYERALHYYVDGLKYAGSAYAFHTLGSCIAVNIDDYAKVRGFPKRAGGEDFYLLNKLAKLGKVAEANSEPLLIAARLSQRAPFGTGAAVNAILALDKGECYRYYNPQVFVELARVLSQLDYLYDFKEDWDTWFKGLSQRLQAALLAINVQHLFMHLSSQVFDRAQFNKQIHHWFDAFKTLRFIHSLEADLPRLPLEQAVKDFSLMISK